MESSAKKAGKCIAPAIASVSSFVTPSYNYDASATLGKSSENVTDVDAANGIANSTDDDNQKVSRLK
jgi:hypothetical protein